MYAFRKPPPARSAMFIVSYDDGRTAYLWLDDHAKTDDHLVGTIARTRQEQGALPEGTITSVRRVR